MNSIKKKIKHLRATLIMIALLISGICFTSTANSNSAIGEESAKITIKVFSSLTCPHCANFHNKIFEELKKEYIDTKKVKFEHHSFPLDLAALNAEKILSCFTDKETSFKFLNQVYKKQTEWAVGSDIKKINKSIKLIGKEFGLSNIKMDSCIADTKIEDKILNSRVLAQKDYKISSTPTIFINDKKYKGDHNYKSFKKELNKILQ